MNLDEFLQHLAMTRAVFYLDPQGRIRAHNVDCQKCPVEILALESGVSALLQEHALPGEWVSVWGNGEGLGLSEGDVCKILRAADQHRSDIDYDPVVRRQLLHACKLKEE